MFLLARSFTRKINGERDEKELEKYIIEKPIRELEYLLQKNEQKIFLIVN